MDGSPEDLLQGSHASLWRNQLLHRLAGHNLPSSPLGDGAGLVHFTPVAPKASPSANGEHNKPEPMVEFFHLRQRVLVLTTNVAIGASLFATFFWNLQTGLSLLAGAFSGIVYLLLLSRTVERLGKRSNKLGKAHLAAPILVFILALRLDGLDFLPALVGFLLYKPAILLIAFRDLTSPAASPVSISGPPPA